MVDRKYASFSFGKVLLKLLGIQKSVSALFAYKILTGYSSTQMSQVASEETNSSSVTLLRNRS